MQVLKAKFTYRLMLPFEPGVLEMGSCTKEEMCKIFKNYDWDTVLKSITHIKDWEDLVNSPGIQIEKLGANEFLKISNVGKLGAYEFMVSYTRPYRQKYFWGLWSKFFPAYASYRAYQSPEQILSYIDDFFEGVIHKF